MDLISFMEMMCTNNVPLIAAFFIGLMTAISPCPLTTNITAIAYVSKRIENSKHTLIVSLLYTLGRMVTYVTLASLIVWVGVNVQAISLFLQEYGERVLGPALVILGVIMLDIFRINLFKTNWNFDLLQNNFGEKGFIGSFLLGALFALAFCPFSGVLFFGMLIPLAIKARDGLFIPSVFAFATGLPVIILSLVFVTSVSKLGNIINKIQTFEKWARTAVAIMFILVGSYYIGIYLFGW